MKKKIPEQQQYQYSGRIFTSEEIALMRRIIAEDPRRRRAQISRLVCEAIGWLKPDGGLKDMRCRVVMLQMQEDGLLTLPPPRSAPRKKPSVRLTTASDPKNEILCSVDNLSGLSLVQVKNKKQSYLWNEYIQRYHYLGYKPLAGAQIRYFAFFGDQMLAALGFASPAWKVSPRDQFIGWNEEQRQKQLHLIINNTRFLILPWVHSPNLASKLLAMTAKILPKDWQIRYGYSPVLLETFVESPRFKGTCYKAANWVYVGQTKGIGKYGLGRKKPLPKKDIWVYPLCKNFQKTLSRSDKKGN